MAAQVLAFAIFIAGAHGWRCAKYQHYFSQQPDYIDCLWDCCGNSFNRHCCAPIGIIVGCCIVGAVVVAALVVLFICWWHRRRARYTKGPRLFHNRRHSHYPVAPSSVTRPAQDLEYKPMPPGHGYGHDERYRMEKPPLDAYHDEPSEHRGYRPPGRGYGPPPSRDYGPPPGRDYGPPPSRDFEAPLGRGRGPPESRGPPPDRSRGPPPDRGYGPPPDRSRGPPPDRGYGPPPDRSRGPPPDRSRGPPSERSFGPPSDQGPRQSPRPSAPIMHGEKPAPKEFNI